MAASEKKLSLLAIVAGGLVGVALFQNCSPNRVQSNALDRISTTPSPPGPACASNMGQTCENTCARVTPRSGCSHEGHVVASGTIQCDGSCQ